jgi:penicillin amidase
MVKRLHSNARAGVCGRLFHPHTKDQVDAFMRGDKVYWWFSDKAIKEHTQTRLELEPDSSATP